MLILTTLLTGCSSSNLCDDYPSLDKNNIVKEITAQELYNKIANKDSFMIMMGFTECPWCQALMPVYNSVAVESGLKEIYYINIKEMRNNVDSSEHIYYLGLKEYFSEAVDAVNDRISAPTVIAVKDGKLVGYNIGTVADHVKDETGTLPTLTSDQKSRLSDILTDLFMLIKQ